MNTEIPVSLKINESDLQAGRLFGPCTSSQMDGLSRVPGSILLNISQEWSKTCYTQRVSDCWGLMRNSHHTVMIQSSGQSMQGILTTTLGNKVEKRNGIGIDNMRSQLMQHVFTLL